MDLILQNADFSETGIAVPTAVVLNAGTKANVATGVIAQDENRTLSDPVPVTKKFAKLYTGNKTSCQFLFWNGDTYLGVGSNTEDGIYGSFALRTPSLEVDVTSFSHYDSNGGTFNVANATHYRILIFKAYDSSLAMEVNTTEI